MTRTGYTEHASIRLQQRGIAPAAVEALLDFGSTVHDHHGAQIVLFDRRAWRRLERSIGAQQLRELEPYRTIYAVRANDGSLVTVGHRWRRVKRDLAIR